MQGLYGSTMYFVVCTVSAAPRFICISTRFEGAVDVLVVGAVQDAVAVLILDRRVEPVVRAQRVRILVQHVLPPGLDPAVVELDHVGQAVAVGVALVVGERPVGVEVERRRVVGVDGETPAVC